MICNMCGKNLDIFDMQSGLTMFKTLGYGSVHDGSKIKLRLCCDCTDKIADSCKISPIDSAFSDAEPDEKE